jgi:DNA-binding CsgD family transcriptional regulator/pimeloyl-ACP methyl ester carboxylesterase
MNAPPVQYVKTSDGYDIAYTVTGKGVPFVYMPEIVFHCVEMAWKSAAVRTFWQPLADRFQLVQYDARGGGNSSRGLRADHSVDHWVLDCEAVVDRLRLSRFILYAHVVSAHPALLYALRHPDRVAALILVNPSPADGGVYMKLLEDLYRNSWNMFLNVFTATLYPGGDEDWVSYCRNGMSQDDLIKAVLAGVGFTFEDLLPSVKAPTLVMVNRTPASPAYGDAARTLATSIPNSRLVLFEGVQNREILYVADPITGLPPVIPVIEDFLKGLTLIDTAMAPDFLSDTSEAGKLSSRETEVLRLLARGKSNPEIAKELFITRNTVQNHVSSILIKTNLGNRTEAAVYARDHGLV